MLSIILTSAATTFACNAIRCIKHNAINFDRDVHKSEAVQIAYDKLVKAVEHADEIDDKLYAAEVAEVTPFLTVQCDMQGYKPAYWKTMQKRAENAVNEAAAEYKKARACAATEVVMYGEVRDAKTRLDLHQKYDIVKRMHIHGDPEEFKTLVEKYNALKDDGYEQVELLGVNSIEKALGEESPQVVMEGDPYAALIDKYHKVVTVVFENAKDTSYGKPLLSARYLEDNVDIPNNCGLELKNGSVVFFNFSSVPGVEDYCQGYRHNVLREFHDVGYEKLSRFNQGQDVSNVEIPDKIQVKTTTGNLYDIEFAPGSTQSHRRDVICHPLNAMQGDKVTASK